MPSQSSLYDSLIARIFAKRRKGRATEFEFDRAEIEHAAAELGLRLPKNLGDLIYSYRYRKPLPQEVRATEPPGLEWAILPAGPAKYRFKLAKPVSIVPRQGLIVTKIPDATPEIVSAWRLTDEQALLARIRYNRLIDIFLGLASYSLQNHLRTTVKGMGQIEIDEIYVGVNKSGAQFIIPVQAKRGGDKLAAIQTLQDLAYCAEKFPTLDARAISAQSLDDGGIALFELGLDGGEVRVLDERHYALVPATSIQPEDLQRYNRG